MTKKVSEQPPHEDCISREAAIKAIQKEYEEAKADKASSGYLTVLAYLTGLANAAFLIHELPSVKPQIEEYDKYHDLDKLKVGDEVMNKKITAVVLSINADRFFTCIDKTGHVYMYQDPTLWTKTGRRYAQIVVTPGGELDTNE